MTDGVDLWECLQAAGRLLVAGRKDEGRDEHVAVWNAALRAEDDYVACAAAHLLGAISPDGSDEQRDWHVAALACAERVPPGYVGSGGPIESWYPSLYISLGQTHRLTSHVEDARACFEKARDAAAVMPDSPFAEAVRTSAERALDELGRALRHD